MMVRIRRIAFLTMTFERLWPLLLPLIILICLFAIIAWFGLFQRMPQWLHISLLMLFAIGVLCGLYLPTRLCVPNEIEVDHYLQSTNLLIHQPISVQKDRLVSGKQDPLAEVLWQEHRRRQAEQIKDLRSGIPRPHVPEHDPFALRAVVALLFVIAFAYASGPSGGSLMEVFRIQKTFSSIPPRIDAWVTPPHYTGRAPIFLTSETNKWKTDFTVPRSSIVTMRIIGGRGNEKLMTKLNDGTQHKIEPNPLPSIQKSKNQQDVLAIENALQFQVPLENTTSLTLSSDAINALWSFTLIPDTPPLIHFTKDPHHTSNGILELFYSASDDYGVSEAHADIVEANGQTIGGHPLFKAPEIPLSVPHSGAESKEEMISKDITDHPWAGSNVQLTLVATDNIGQEGRSETKTLILPERPFFHPLARAIIEKRRILAVNANQRDHVLDMLSAIMLSPETMITNITHFLAFRSLYMRLKLAHNDDELRDVVDYMWQIAHGIEDGQPNPIQKRLKQAQHIIKQALKNGAKPEEIEKLMAELRQAMQEFLHALAQQQQQNPDLKQAIDPNMIMLTQKDLDRMMNQIEDLVKQGSRDQAQQFLSRLEMMINNLRMEKNQQAIIQEQQKQMHQQMNKLGELIRHQQELMNKTFQLDQTIQNQQNVEKHNQQRNILQILQQSQEKLQSELRQFVQALKAMGTEPSKKFDEAGEAMGRAGKALGRAEGAKATDQQSYALDALRDGMRAIMQKLQQASDEKSLRDNPDPFGRQRVPADSNFDQNVKLPNKIDIQKAREILEKIRQRLGNSLSPQIEKDYLERLLKLD